MDKRLLATVDIGSHSCILLIAAFEPAETEGAEPRKVLVPKLQKVEICRLGEDIYDSGRISEEKIQDLCRIMTKFRMDLHALGVELKAAAMTEAMRRAENQEEVLDAVEKALWMRPRIISGEEEAALTYRSVKEWHGEGIVMLLDIPEHRERLLPHERKMALVTGIHHFSVFNNNKLGCR